MFSNPYNILPKGWEAGPWATLEGGGTGEIEQNSVLARATITLTIVIL